MDAGITEIAVPTSRLRTQLPPTVLSDFMAPADAATATATTASPSAKPSTAATEAATPIKTSATASATEEAAAEDSPNDMDDFEATDEATEQSAAGQSSDSPGDEHHGLGNSESDEEDLPRSRDKSDIFHIFQNIPLAKKSSVRPLISRLLIHATFYFDQDDYDKVSRYLAEEKGIVTTEMLLRDFYHNRFWWRRRVRMYTPSADEHAKRIALVHKMIQTEAVFKKAYGNELAQYLYGFEEKAKQGKFEELADVPMFTWDGTDSNGLDLWLTNRGSTRAENFHQKLMTALGPYSVGAQTAHFIMVQVTFRFDVNSGIRRLDEHNFGHPYLMVIDRIKSSYLRIMGIDIFPKHLNLEEFAAIEDYFAVGIGPLGLSEKFIEPGEPHHLLKGDLKFLSKRQGLVCSPRHIQHKKEFEIFNQFMESHPSPNGRDWEELAIVFKQRTDFVDIFPKLPGMLKTYHTRWKETQSIVMAELQVKGAYNSLLFGLALPVSSPVSVAPPKELQQLEEDQKSSPDEFAREQSRKRARKARPLAAPTQKNYVPLLEPGKSKQQACFYAAFGCLEIASVCGGWRKGSCCSTVKDGKIVLPPEEEQAKIRRDYSLKKESERKAAKRKKNKE